MSQSDFQLRAVISYSHIGHDFVKVALDNFVDINKTSVVVTANELGGGAIEFTARANMDKKATTQSLIHLIRVLTEHAATVLSVEMRV